MLFLATPAAHALTEFLRVKANDAESNDNFGYSVGVSGGTAVVGAWKDDDISLGAGSAYIFNNPGTGTWSQLDKLTASDGAFGDNFGTAVAISGNTVIVGSPFDDNRGSAYLFRDNGSGDWLQLDKVVASDGASGDQLGFSVAISGNTAVLGAKMDNGSIGAAYVFRDNGSGDWQQVTKLTANDGLGGDEFGNSVAISGNTVLVGAHFESNAGGGAAGAVYVFQEDGASWSQVDKLMATDGSVGKQFGASVAFSSNTAVVGAIGDLTSGVQAGAAYVFQRDVSEDWSQADKLLAGDGMMVDQFGYSVALSGNVVIVGANQDEVGVGTAGSAYLFSDNGLGNWNQFAKLQSSSPAGGDTLGTSVGISGSTAFVGAPLANNAAGAGGVDSGAVYLYNVAVPTGLAGDYDNDGTVTAADYVVWRRLRGMSGAGLAADDNGDGTVNQGDYQLWRENFGLTSLGSATAAAVLVPEPRTAMLLCLLACLQLCRRASHFSRP